MKRAPLVTAAALTVAIAVLPAAANAETFEAATSRPSLAEAARVEAIRFVAAETAPRPSRSLLAANRAGTARTARKIGYGIGLGFAGLLGGMLIGSLFGRDCSCDDPGLKGAVYGAPIGAAAGAAFGVWLGGR